MPPLANERLGHIEAIAAGRVDADARERRDPSRILVSHLRTFDFGDYATLAWVATSISRITGALGLGLEEDEEVREAVNYR